MSKYVTILAWLGIVSVFASNVKVKKTELVEGVEVKRYYWLFAFIVFLPVIFMAGFRGSVADTDSYVISFHHSPITLGEIPDYVSSRHKDRGFYLFQALIHVFITRDKRIYFLIIAFLQGLILIIVYRKYSSQYLYSVFLFVASTDYVAWMFNGIRQFIVATAIFAATPLLIKRKVIPVALMILLLSTFHQSALIMIPIVFIVQGKAWNQKTLIFIALILLAIIFVDKFTNLMDESLENTQYSSMVTDYTTMKDDGTSPIRVLVYCIPTVLAFIGRKKIQEADSRLLNLSVNMSIISTGLYILSIFTSGIFLGRLPIYCSLYNYILLPWEIKNIFDEKDSKLVFPISVVAYLMFYYYQMHMSWGLF